MGTIPMRAEKVKFYGGPCHGVSTKIEPVCMPLDFTVKIMSRVHVYSPARDLDDPSDFTIFHKWFEMTGYYPYEYRGERR